MSLRCPWADHLLRCPGLHWSYEERCCFNSLDRADAGAWTAVNSALASGDVTVYFSARTAASDANNVYGAGVAVTSRSDTSANILTFNGRSFYNTDNDSPSWSAQTGTGRSQVLNFISQNAGHTKYSNIVIDGFYVEALASGKAISICGDNWIVQNCDISHTVVGSSGPLVMLVPTSDAVHEGTADYCVASSNIQFIGNTFHDSYGECLYLGGAGCSETDPTLSETYCNGFPSHDTIVVSGNTFYNCGTRGSTG